MVCNFLLYEFSATAIHFYLKKGFEVCGILEDVVVPSKPNVNGEVYGFVRFSKVRDVSKLLKAVNAVYFGNFCVRAKVARFDRSAGLVVRGANTTEDAGGRGGEDVQGERKNVKKGVGGSVKGKEIGEGEKRVRLGVHGAGAGMLEAVGGCKGTGGADVRVGDVVVMVRGGKGKGAEKREVEKVVTKTVEEMVIKGNEVGKSQDQRVVTGTQHVKKLVQMYRYHEEDLKWAYNGVVASVINGEAITLVQNRIEDVGFTDLDIIPMGADRIFIRSLFAGDVLQNIEVESEFFNLILANVKKWDKIAVPFQRGA